MSIYNDILDQQGGNHRAAGDLHEVLWSRLLAKEDPRFHNVRLAGGDGGVDGIIVTDPALGNVTVFQAKFFKNITQKANRDAILESFTRAHNHGFTVSEWVLLVPVPLSTKEIDWLSSGELQRHAGARLDISRKCRLDQCVVKYREGSELERLAERNLTVTADLLPKSAKALQKIIATERRLKTRLQLEIVDRLRTINEDIIRQRKIETVRAQSALKALRKGWADHTLMLDQTRRENAAPGLVQEYTRDFMEFIRQRLDLAFMTEGLCEGISVKLSEIFATTFHLSAAAGRAQIPNMKAEKATMWKLLGTLLDQCREFDIELAKAVGKFV
ncbi:hypothetical protein [Paraburkholderia phenazinium]|uniref:Restriction endonuclease n=1 Tax=Paraburkholderia phenazinium TaxID=60549 RepID=A0A1N6I6P3_9BURK|nr:hypothetical protein [Paraburkholderia phenazinium]SIO27674.1 hypothetical protein SAMN05444165_1861 [Paraburkholderia phenazinium]